MSATHGSHTPSDPRTARVGGADAGAHAASATGGLGQHFSGAHGYETRAEERAEHESLGAMFSALTEKLSLLMRQEVALAKAEATDSAKKAGTGIGMGVGAALAGFFVLLFLSLTLMYALGALMPLGWSALIVALLWAGAAAFLGLSAKKHFEKIKGLQQTQETVQEMPDTLNPTKETP